MVQNPHIDAPLTGEAIPEFVETAVFKRDVFSETRAGYFATPSTPRTALRPRISRFANIHASGFDHQGAALTTRRMMRVSGSPAK